MYQWCMWPANKATPSIVSIYPVHETGQKERQIWNQLFYKHVFFINETYTVLKIAQSVLITS